jgi:hypothetical protein
MFPCGWEPLDEGRVNWFSLKETSLLIWQKVNNAEKIGIRKKVQYFLKRTLGTGVAREPLMDNCDASHLAVSR